MPSPDAAPKRRRPAERVTEITAAAATIGLTEGLERVTLRRVAEHIAVRPGLIHHYFPEADSLVAEAFLHATKTEQETLFTRPGAAGPREQLQLFFTEALSPESLQYSRLWLNARNLSRFNDALKRAVTERETSNRELLGSILREGNALGHFTCDDDEQAALLTMILLDALSSYANGGAEELEARVVATVIGTVERELGLEAHTLLPDHF